MPFLPLKRMSEVFVIGDDLALKNCPDCMRRGDRNAALPRKAGSKHALSGQGSLGHPFEHMFKEANERRNNSSIG